MLHGEFIALRRFGFVAQVIDCVARWDDCVAMEPGREKTVEIQSSPIRAECF